MRRHQWLLRYALVASALVLNGAGGMAFADEESVPPEVVVEDGVPVDGIDAEVVVDETMVDGEAGVGEEMPVVDAPPPELTDCGEACMFYSMGSGPDDGAGGEVIEFSAEGGAPGEVPEGAIDMSSVGGVADYLESNGEVLVDSGTASVAPVAVVEEAQPYAEADESRGAAGVIRGGHLR